MDANTQEILLILQEECAEVTQAISKCFRFGLEQIKPGKSKSNLEHLQEELGDLLCMIQLLQDMDIVTDAALEEARLAKLQKLKCWSNISIPE
jgi:NTP pyrophosphatase (non-canonical NTP hydrolase)